MFITVSLWPPLFFNKSKSLSGDIPVPCAAANALPYGELMSEWKLDDVDLLFAVIGLILLLLTF